MFQKCIFRSVLGLLVAALTFSTMCIYPRQTSAAVLRTITCSTADQIQNALKNAQAGDRIVIKPGTYVGNTSTSGNSKAHFYSGKSGTSANKIILESETTSDKAVLKGTSFDASYVLYITGDNWEIKNVKVTYAQKGVVLDNANDNKLIGVNVYTVGQEGIHIRDGSDRNVIDGCTVKATGRASGQKGYGEGIYIGTDRASWDVNGGSYARDCNDNTIQNCTIGPDVTAESIDIKEGTFGTKVLNNTFMGAGISGENSADTFIDIKGRNVTVSGNKFYKQNNSIITGSYSETNRTSSSPWCPSSETANGSTSDTSDGNTYSNNSTYSGNP